MKKILVTLAICLTAAPVLAASKAQYETFYGTVHTLCFGASTTPGAGCKAWLQTEWKSYNLNGNFTKIAKYNGKTVAIKGIAECLGDGSGPNCAIGVKSIKAAAAMPLAGAPSTGTAVARDANTSGGTKGNEGGSSGGGVSR